MTCIIIKKQHVYSQQCNLQNLGKLLIPLCEFLTEEFKFLWQGYVRSLVCKYGRDNSKQLHQVEHVNLFKSFHQNINMPYTKDQKIKKEKKPILKYLIQKIIAPCRARAFSIEIN